MKKFILPILLAFVSLLVLVDQVTAQTLHPPDAQTKKITCEELYDLALSKVSACKVADITFEGYVWCAQNQAEFDNYRRDEIGLSLYYKELAPSYTYDFNREQCFESLAEGKGITPQLETPRQARQSDGGRQSGLIEFFGINPYQTWLRLIETMEVSEFITSGGIEEFGDTFFARLGGAKTPAEKEAAMVKARDDSYKNLFGENWQETVNRQPALIPKVEQEAWKVKAPAGENVTDVPGTSNTKRYSWDTDSGAVINSSSWENVEFKEPIVDEQEITRTVKFKGPGEVEVKVKNTDPTQNKVKVETDFFDLFVIQTHFWVNYDPEKKVAVVGVYEGEVEVISRDGKTVRIKPEGDKPGTVVISRKLSVAKLVTVGAAAAVIIGGLVWLVKKKRSKRDWKK